MTPAPIDTVRQALEAEPTSLYRFFDRSGRLLYVGITARGRGRWHQHSADKEWWGDVASATIEHFPDRPSAIKAERTAIKAESPVHNVIHNDAPRQRKSLNIEHPQRKPSGAPGVVFRSLRSGYWKAGSLWLEPEIHMEPCVDNCDGDGFDQFHYWLDRVMPDVTEHGPRISWFVNTTCGSFEAAPYQSHLPWVHEDFLDAYSWPRVVPDSFNGPAWASDLYARCEPIDWFQLPVKWDRFPEFVAELGWHPSPLQTHMPLDTIMRSRNGAR